jgi:hypothetical protein
MLISLSLINNTILLISKKYSLFIPLDQQGQTTSLHFIHSFLNLLFKYTNFTELECKSNHIGNRLDGLEDLLQHTKFTRAELQRMYRGFKNVSI